MPPGQSGVSSPSLTSLVPSLKNVMDRIQESASMVTRTSFPSIPVRMSPYWSATSKHPSPILDGYPRRTSSLPPDVSPLNSLPISAGLMSILLILDTDGSPDCFSWANVSLRISPSPAKFRSAISFQTMTVSEMPLREIELRTLISRDARNAAAWALDPGTSSRYIVMCVSVL